MCMKNVNANFLLSRSVQQYGNGIQTYNGVFNGIVPNTNEYGIEFLDDFNVSLFCSIMFNKDQYGDIIEQTESIQLNKEYEFMIRLTHVRSGASIMLDRFNVGLTKEKLTNWCKAFYEFNRKIKVSHLELPKGRGDYALKLFIREKTDDTDTPWITQLISSLSVCDYVVGSK